jgi:hypothetical protein
MMWTYRVFRDSQERYSIREVFYERDNTIISYAEAPVVVVGASFEELMQLVQWFRDAFDLPVLSLEEIDAEMAINKTKSASNGPPNLSLQQVIKAHSIKSVGRSAFAEVLFSTSNLFLPVSIRKLD